MLLCFFSGLKTDGFGRGAAMVGEDDLNALYGDVAGGEGDGEVVKGEGDAPTASAKAETLEQVYQHEFKPEKREAPNEASTAARSASRATPDAATKGDGALSVYVGNLQWWTTDAEVETACSEYGRIESVTFFEEKTNGKSKGYALVTFVDASGASACQENLNGRDMNGKKCVVAFQHQNTPQANPYGSGSAGGPSKGRSPPVKSRDRDRDRDRDRGYQRSGYRSSGGGRSYGDRYEPYGGGGGYRRGYDRDRDRDRDRGRDRRY